MKLFNDFFEVLETSAGEADLITTIRLNPGHIIYSGHFPGQPVTPGVIQLQIVHEILEKHFCKSLKLISMPGCKFLNILNPDQTPRVIIHIGFARTGELLHITARGEMDTNIFFKLESFFQFL